MSDGELLGHLKPEAAELLRNMQAVGFRGFAAMGLEGARAAIQQMSSNLGGPVEQVARVQPVEIPRPDGSLLTGELYIPETMHSCPAMVYMHGGGFVMGSHRSVDALVRALANRSGCAILSIDYRLAPEEKYPAALADVGHALEWLQNNAETYGLDTSRLAVGGDSSGGNLAAAACLKARDEGGPQVAFQLLVNPPFDTECNTDSYKRFGDGAISALSIADVAWFCEHYVKHADELKDPYISLLKAKSLSGLPRALLILAEIDPLFDEQMQFADRLRAAGVPLEVRIFPGMFHGFWRMASALPDAAQAIDFAARRMKEALRGQSRSATS